MNKFRLILVVCLISTFVLSPFQAFALEHEHSITAQYSENEQVEYDYCATKSGTSQKSILIPNKAYPESKHEYANNSTEEYSYCVDGASKLIISFSDFTKTEENYDIITIIDKQGEIVGEYSGTQLAGKSVIVDSDEFNISLNADRSKTYYGFSIDSIVALDSNNCQVTLPSTAYPETGHNYGNNKNITCSYSLAGASSIHLDLSSKVKLEDKYDFIYIYDGNNKLVKTITGEIDKNDLALDIKGSAFTVKLVSDHSKDFYGFSVDKITATYEDYTILEKDDTYNYLTPQAKYPSTSHNYYNNQDLSYTYSYPNAKALAVTFSEKTQTEANVDYIYIYDGTNNLISKYSGTELAGKTVGIPTGSFKIRFTSDYSATYYGFSIDMIEAFVSANGDTTSMRYVTGDILPESKHNYGNNIDEIFYYTDTKAKSNTIKFSSKTMTENKYDYIYIYNEDTGKLVGSYTGSELAGKRVKIDASSFSVRLETDHSSTYYGYSIDFIISDYGNTSFESNSNYYPESTHKYDNYANQSFEYVAPNPAVSSLEIKFSAQTKTEANYDFIYIYDENGKQVGKYSGTELANRVVSVAGGSFKIKLTSDHSQAYYGFSIDSITAKLNTDYYEEIELEHNYVVLENVKANAQHIGVEYYRCENCGDEYRVITPKIIPASSLEYKLSDYSYFYDGEQHQPTVKVYDENGKLMTQNVDYTLKYSGDGVDMGKYYIYVSMLREGYTGTKTLTYQVMPRYTTSVQTESVLAGFNVSWSKVSGPVDGYEIQYSEYSDFRTFSSAAVSASTTKKSFTNLYQCFRYYVRIYTYAYNSKGEKVYSFAITKTVDTKSKLKYYYNQNDYGDENNPDHDYSRPSGEKKTIATSGCGVVSTTIALNYLAGFEYYSVPEVASFSKNCGARDAYGTNLFTLLDNLMKYNKKLTYTTTESGAALVNHVRNGGVAIINQSEYLARNGYPLFSTNGHYVVAYDADEYGNVYVADPAYTSSRYKTDFCVANIKKETLNGCLVNIDIINKATAPTSYYLLSYK